jgi:uncharacterized protein (TIGR03083 family)
MADLMPMIHAERASLGEYLDTVPADEWAGPTWCASWSTQQLVGHLVAAARITAPHFFGGFVRCGFSFDRFVDRDLRQYAAGSPAEVKARYDAIITSTRTPPGPAYVALGEVMVHGEDIRRPRGDRGDHPEEHLVTLAELYKNTGAPLRAKQRLEGLRLRATDVDWSTGEGDEVRGPCMSLILAMVGRAGALADCDGPGVETLRARGTDPTGASSQP